MRVSMLAAAVAVVAVALPAQAVAARYSGVVLAKQPQRGTIVLAGAGGAGLTVHASAARLHAGDRVDLRAARLRDGTVTASRLAVRSHTTRAAIRGTVVRQLAHSTLVATGGSVITIRRDATPSRLRAGSTATFSVRIGDDDELVGEAEAAVAAPAGAVEIEGRIVSVAPFVVSVEGLSITITVPAGMTLPATLAAGARIELMVQVGTGNVFTLVAIDEVENAVPAAAQEVEVKGLVTSSTTSQLVVVSHGMTFTFTAPPGVNLPVIPVGTAVEAKGVSANGVLTLLRVKVEDDGGDDGGSGSGHHGG